jgi:DhnA family fructose-bisphosphate aldolase class Ia
VSGKFLRLRRILRPATGRALVLPLDHAVSTGVTPGLDDLRRVVRLGNAYGADAIVVHKGALRVLVRDREPALLDRLGVIVHLSGATSMSPRPVRKIPVCDVDEALELGADGVSVHVNFGCSDEGEMVRHMARVAHRAERHGVPLLVMAYVRNDRSVESVDPRDVVHAARVAEELGADLIKVSFPGMEGMEALAQGIHTPVLVAGGAKLPEAAFLNLVMRSVETGAAGVAAGRNVFEAEDAGALIAKLSSLVHGRRIEAQGVPLRYGLAQ